MSPSIFSDGTPAVPPVLRETLTTPPELAGPLPRSVRITSAGITTAVYALVLLALAVAGVGWLGTRTVQELEHRAALRQRGVVTSGEITRFWTRGGFPHVTYTFSVNGTSYTGNTAVPRELEPKLHELDFLDVCYLSNNPAVNHPAAWEQSAPSLVTPFIVPLVPALFAYLFLIDFPFEKQLAAEGAFAAAVVAKSYSARGGLGVHYEFHTQDGATVEGSGVCGGRREIGVCVGVLYLPQNPRRNQLYPLRYYRVAR